MRKQMLVLGAIAAIAVSACGGGGSAGTPKPSVPTAVGDGEGALNLVAWSGYVVGGTGGEQVEGYDWVTPFEQASGCKVTVKVGLDSSNMVQLMKTGEYDGVSASGDATLRLIAGGDVSPVNLDLIPNYKDVFEGLKNQPYNTVDGQSYGVPHGRGANVLMYNPAVVTTPPDSWSAVFEADSPYKGKVTAYNYAIYIADAALYLMKTKPDLKITNPYALDSKQFQAAVDLLKAQNSNIGEYWSDYLKSIQSFKSGDTVVGTSWQIIVNLAQGEKAPVAAVLPSEGATGWSDTWQVATKSQHKTCAYKWLDWIISPKVNAEVAEWFGEAPANQKSCALTSDKNFCKTFHADDEAYFSKVWYWTTPIRQCLDGRTNADCMDYGQWTTAWQQIKG